MEQPKGTNSLNRGGWQFPELFLCEEGLCSARPVKVSRVQNFWGCRLAAPEFFARPLYLQRCITTAKSTLTYIDRLLGFLLFRPVSSMPFLFIYFYFIFLHCNGLPVALASKYQNGLCNSADDTSSAPRPYRRKPELLFVRPEPYSLALHHVKGGRRHCQRVRGL